MPISNVLRTTVALLSISALSGTLAHAAPGDYKIVRSFPAPVVSPDGVAWDGTSVWTTECTSEDIYRLDPAGGAVTAKHTIADVFIDHLTWDGTFLWGNDHHNKSSIHKIDPKTMSVVKTIDVAWENLMGVAWDGAALWTSDPDSAQIYKLDPESGQTLDSFTFPFPSANPQNQLCGLGWDGVCLWVGDIVNRRYHQVDPVTRQVVLSIETPGGEGNMPTGFAFDGKYIWIADENPQRPMLFQLDVEFNSTGPCAHGVDEGQACDAQTGPACKGDDLVCVASGTAQACRKACVRGQSPGCPIGHTCWKLSAVAACLPDAVGGPGGAFGDVCQAGVDCQSDLCVASTAGHICSERCDQNRVDSCPAGYACRAGDDGADVCVAEADPADASGSGCALAGTSAMSGSVMPTLWFVVLVIVISMRRRVHSRRAR